MAKRRPVVKPTKVHEYQRIKRAERVMLRSNTDKQTPAEMRERAAYESRTTPDVTHQPRFKGCRLANPAKVKREVDAEIARYMARKEGRL